MNNIIDIILNLIKQIFNKFKPFIDEFTCKILVKSLIIKRNDLIKQEENNHQQISKIRANFHEKEEEIRSNEQLKHLEQKARASLSIIVSYVNLVRTRVDEILPQRLGEEQNYQQVLIANLMSLVNESRENKEGSSYSRLLTLPWNNSRWNPSENNIKNYNYYPQTDGHIPGILRLGELREVEHPSVEQVPLIEPFPPAIIPVRSLDSNRADYRQGHIVILSNDATSRNDAVGAIQSIALRIICTFPVLQLSCVFIDPIGMGNNFPFNNMPNSIAGPKTFTRSDDIREKLKNLTTHVEQVIQNYLGKDYETIEDFNKAKSFVKEAYRYLFIADFPTHFDTNSLEDLKSLLLNGARAGVYVVIHIDETIEKMRDFNYEFFQSYCTVLQYEYKNNQNLLCTTQLPNGLIFRILLDKPPENKQFNQLKGVIAKASKEVKTKTVPYQEILSKDSMWSDVFDSRREIRAAIGIVGAREQLEFWLGKNEDGSEVSHALLAGKPGAGKSYTLHAIITSLTARYAPDELELYLLDFKEGVEFQLYVDPERFEFTDPNSQLSEEKALPHARVISIESDREFGLSVLKYILNLLEERGRKFKNVGVTTLKDYRDKCREKMPRILVVIDEFQYMFRENDKITQQLNSIFEDLTKRGRAFGIHLLLASQSPNVTNINRSIYSFIDLRMAQQMDKNTAALVLAEGNADAVDLLDRPGKIIYNHDFGRRSYNRIGQVVDMSPSARQKILLRIQSVAVEKSYKRQQPLILFDGTRPTKLSHNRQLTQLSEMPHWLSPKNLNKEVFQEPDWLVEETPGVAWLGEAMQIGNHTKAIFRRRPRSNMLLVGSSEETIFGILSGIVLSFIHCYEPRKVEFQIIDLFSPNNNWAEMFVLFRDAFTQYFPIMLGKRFPKPEKQIVQSEIILQNIYTEFERRQQQLNNNPNEISQGASIFFVCAIGGLNRFQNLRPVAGRRSEELSPDAEKLVKLVAKGPELGIHTIVWVDDMKTFFKVTPDSKAWLTHFDLRVGLKMPQNDSRELLGENYAHNLPRLRAYFKDESTTTGMEKFKPYSVPSTQEIIDSSERLKQRCLD